MKSKVQPFSASTTITLEQPEEQSPDLYSPKPSIKPTMQVSIRSNGHPNLNGHIIRHIISTHQILLLNYGRADTWYFSADTFDVTELHNTTKHYGPYTLHITIHQKDRINGTIRWVPPALKNETILQALRIVSKLEPTISEVPHTNNRSFTILSDSPSTIPHYIKLNYKNTAINLLIAIPGRRQACQTCGSTRRWTSQCQILSEEADQVHTIDITTANDASPGTSA